MFSADLGGYTPPPVDATNPPFNKVALLLHGDGTNGAQNNTFVDSSTNNFTITRTGNVAQGTFSPFSLAEGQWSNYFAGSSSVGFSGLTTTLSGDFTAECWVYPTAHSATYSIIFSASSLYNVQIGYYPNGSVIAYLNGGAINGSGVGSVVTNAWNHFAIVRSGSTVTAYVNGTSIGTATNSNTFNININRIGSLSNGTDYAVYGYLSNVRVTNTAVYTSNFTPSTTPLTAISGTQLLTCQSNRFIDKSSNNYAATITGTPSVTAFSPFAPSAAYSASTNGGSAYFDGSGDYLDAAVGSFTLGTSDFTIEWFQNRSDTTSRNLINIGSTLIRSATNGTNGLQIYKTDNTINVLCSPSIALNTWNHIAIVRSSGVFSMYVNGISQTLTTNVNGGSIATTSTIQIGKADVSAYYSDFLGYASNVRLVASAVYTANFTPPTAPLTAVTNTKLLLNCTNAGIFDNAGKNDIETVGNAQVSTSVKKYGTGSMYFDGTGDWLYLADRPELQLGTGNFTIEGWLYLGATGSARGVVGKGTSTTGWLLSTNTSNQVVFTYGSSTITSTGTLSGSTWYHIAVCREGTGTNQTKIYINGSNDGTGTVNTNFNQTNVMYVGANRTGGDAMNGYIDDLRITQGQALYTSNFTPPTQAFPDQ